MRHALAVGTLVSVIAVLPRPAGAATGLTSIPLVASAGGVTCSCLNLTTDSLDLTLYISDGPPHLVSLGPGGRTTGSLSTVEPTADCKVFRTDGGTLSTKHVACSFTSVDGDGNPTVVVPLNQKIHP